MWPASQHYAVDPMSGAAASLKPEEKSRILGGEACMWYGVDHRGEYRFENLATQCCDCGTPVVSARSAGSRLDVRKTRCVKPAARMAWHDS